MLRARAELASVPVTDIVANHAVGLWQLAVLHLMPDPDPDGLPAAPRLDEARLAIDALGALVDGLGDRLAPHDETLRDALQSAPARLRPGGGRRGPLGRRMSSLIEQYALIGDTQTAALVADDGSIDWLCFPRFDSGACFAALLGNERNGRWLIGPAAGGRATRRKYRDGTLVLETEFDTPDGTVARRRLHADPRPHHRRRPRRRGRERRRHDEVRADRALRLRIGPAVGAGVGQLRS